MFLTLQYYNASYNLIDSVNETKHKVSPEYLLAITSMHMTHHMYTL